MGWWRTATGSVIGDGPANELDETGESWTSPSEIPAELRQRIVDCYRQDLGREPTEQELKELLEFCR